MGPINDPGPPPMTARRSRRPRMDSTGFNAILNFLCQVLSECLNNKSMIFFLRKTRNRDRADHASIFDNDRKAPPMRSIFSFRYQIGLFDTPAFAFEELSDIE